MTPTTTTFSELVEGYLAMRRGLGYRLIRQAVYLDSFARYLDGLGAVGPVSLEQATAWATTTTGSDPQTPARRLMVVRGFLRYLAVLDGETEIPPPGFLGPTKHRSSPHVYSDDELQRLLRAAAGLSPSQGLRPHCYVTLFSLLACTGLRISEALALAREDVDLRPGQPDVHEAAEIAAEGVVVLVHHHRRMSGERTQLREQLEVVLRELVQVALEVRRRRGAVAGLGRRAELDHHVPLDVVGAHAHEDRLHVRRPPRLRELRRGRDAVGEVLGTEDACRDRRAAACEVLDLPPVDPREIDRVGAGAPVARAVERARMRHRRVSEPRCRRLAEHHGVEAVGITLSTRQAERARERVAAAGLAERVEIRVADDGAGVPPAERERIFLLFKQSGVAGRAGIGLALVKAFVEAHGERVWLEDRPSGGACFAFSLPVHVPAIDAAPAEARR